MKKLINEKTLDKKRLFIAINLPEDVKKYLSSLLCDLDKKLEIKSNIKIVPQENIHITLKFIGDFEIKKINDLKKIIKESLKGFESFSYSISSKLGAFPYLKNARIIFAEISNGKESIKQIFNNIDKNLKKIGISKDQKDFIPHITIARLKKSDNMENVISNIDVRINRDLICSNVILFESILKPSGAEYIVLEDFSL